MKKICFLMLMAFLTLSVSAQQNGVEKLIGTYQGEVTQFTNGVGVSRKVSVELAMQEDRDKYKLILRGYKLGNSEFEKITISDVDVTPDHGGWFIGVEASPVYERDSKKTNYYIYYRDQNDQSHIDGKRGEMTLVLFFRMRQADNVFSPYIDATLTFVGKKTATTGIGQVESAVTSAKDTAVYNLSGQRVENPRHGVFIVGGKKVVFK
ncbi:MAG: hypothetical protein K6A82_08155 [Prevotella sp.]|nr:hypothetical protein [Prevotella sp.]